MDKNKETEKLTIVILLLSKCMMRKKNYDTIEK